MVMLSDSVDDREDVRFTQDEQLLAFDRDFGAAVLTVEDLVADLHVHRDAGLLLETARANRHDGTLLRLFLGGIRDVQPTTHLLGLFERLDDDAVGERRYFRGTLGS